MQSVRILVGGHEAAKLDGPPWRARVDFGPLAPAELTAVAYDAAGTEIARASQLLNLPRPTAEFEIGLERDGTAAVLHWHHLMGSKPRQATMSVDGSPLAVDSDWRATLPKLDPLMPHVLSAEMRFADGFVARKEMVIQGLRSDSTGTELTPVMLWQKANEKAADPAGCFTAAGRAVHVSAIEKSPARIFLVQEPFPGKAIDTYHVLWSERQPGGIRDRDPLGRDTSARIQWPIARNFGGGGADAGSSTLFPRSPDLPGNRGGMLWLLTRSFEDRTRIDDPRRFADAVAVAGLNATAGGFRRAVVLVLGDRRDTSHYDPRSVRQYLDSLGVPLFVWSLTGARPDLAGSWGAVDDISTTGKLREATRRLQQVLDSERVVWLAADPITALHVQADERCGVAMGAVQPTR
ncbi:MAG TPA: hypothetical protein VKH35_05060 [Thermoanaerobaculia bacterium]|nr:hypothetical protein [Thermoanaerobaculia bacterium]